MITLEQVKRVVRNERPLSERDKQFLGLTGFINMVNDKHHAIFQTECEFRLGDMWRKEFAARKK